jgi:hypothetical protein
MLSGMIEARRKLWFEHLLPSTHTSQDTSALAYIFPTEKHVRQSAIISGTESMTLSDQGIDWVDSNLNAEQKKAIKDISTKNHDVPYLLFGPAGTGKSGSRECDSVFTNVLGRESRQNENTSRSCAPNYSETTQRVRSRLRPFEFRSGYDRHAIGQKIERGGHAPTTKSNENDCGSSRCSEKHILQFAERPIRTARLANGDEVQGHRDDVYRCRSFDHCSAHECGSLVCAE